MKSLNLFPHRELDLQQKVSQFQRDVVLSVLTSFLLAVGMGAMAQQLDWRWPSGQGWKSHQVVLANESAQRKDVERARQWLEAMASLDMERKQRLLVLRLLHKLSTEPVDGVFLGRLDWSSDGLEVALWTGSPELVSTWAQGVQTLPGLDPQYTHEAIPDADPNPMGLPTYRVRIKLSAETIRP
jgi:hypothetical protein